MTYEARLTLDGTFAESSRLGEGSWVADGYLLPYRTTSPSFHVWTPTGDDGDGNPLGHVLRYLDRSYQLRIR